MKKTFIINDNLAHYDLSKEDFNYLFWNYKESHHYLAKNPYISDELFARLFCNGDKTTRINLCKNTNVKGKRNISEICIPFLAKDLKNEELAVLVFKELVEKDEKYERIKYTLNAVKESLTFMKKILKVTNNYDLAGLFMPQPYRIVKHTFEENKLYYLESKLHYVEGKIESFPYLNKHVDFKTLYSVRKEIERLSAVLEEKRKASERKVYSKIDDREAGPKMYIEILKSYGTFDTYMDEKRYYY